MIETAKRVCSRVIKIVETKEVACEVGGDAM